MSTVTQISGGNSAGTRDPLAFDILAKDGGQLKRRGIVVDHSTFDGTFDGWADHFAYATAAGNLSLTQTYPLTGSHALMLSPHEEATGVATNFLGASGYKRTGWVRSPGLVSVSAWLAIRGTTDQTAGSYPFSSAWLGMDTQLPRGTNRFFGNVALKDKGNGTCAWFVKGGKVSTAAGAASRADVEVANTGQFFTGLNEGKVNYCYVRLTVDLAAAAAGTGYYRELQVANEVFDLRSNTFVPYDLLLNNGSGDMFNGGFNIGVGAGRSTINTGSRQLQMLVDDVVLTVGGSV